MPEERWSDWRWQHRHRLTSLDEIAAVVRLTEAERRAFRAASARFRVAITPYYAALMDPDDPGCPIRRQSIPHPDELVAGPFDLADPLGEERDMPVAGLTHRYPDRVLLYVSHHCAVYCRHCTRKRKVADPTSAASRAQLAAGLDYIRHHPQVRDVLVSGGDPLTLSDPRLDELLGALRSIEHVEIIRLCTRNPATLPMRVTEALVALLRAHQPIFVHTHFNHPRECTPEAARCLRAFADAGLNTGNQMVLLSGINDDTDTVRQTNHWLLRQRCRPYYLLQADLAEGISHFRTPVDKGLEIIAGLVGHTSGMAVPNLVIDAPGGGGKIRLLPQYVRAREGGKLVFENYLGERCEYPVE